jgi:hypothetical protein
MKASLQRDNSQLIWFVLGVRAHCGFIWLEWKRHRCLELVAWCPGWVRPTLDVLCSQICSIDDGILMECSDEQSQNASIPIIFKFDIVEHVIFERMTQSRMHSSPRDSIDVGTVRDVVCWPANAFSWMAFTSGRAGMYEAASIRWFRIGCVSDSFH